MTLRRFAGLAGLVFFALAAVPACGKSAEPERVSSTSYTVRVDTVRVESIHSSVTATGTIAPRPGADWTISAPEPGRVAELPKPVGAAVKEGEILVRFEIPTLEMELLSRQADVASATTHLQTARNAATRAASLLERGLVPQRDADTARRNETDAATALGTAQAGLAVAEHAILGATVKARFAGVITHVFHNVGDLVTGMAADPVVRVIDPTRLEVVATVLASDLSRIFPGRAVRTMSGSDGIIEGAVITTPSLPGGQMLTASAGDVRISLAKPTTLPVGSPVAVEIFTEDADNALVIPMTALFRDGDLPYVLVAGDDGRAHRKSISLGIVTRAKVQVTSGLTAGEKVILAGPDPPTDGAAIVIER